MQNIDVVIIGAGQAGLALSRHLSAAQIDHKILEAGRVGQSWRSRRWQSLQLFTPNWLNRLPGVGGAGMDKDGFTAACSVADMLTDFAWNWSCPVQGNTKVLNVMPAGSDFHVETPGEVFKARCVVFATGAYTDNRPGNANATHVPGVMQIGSADYEAADTLPPGAVLVIGAGASGVQITDELALSGRRVVLSAGTHTRAPRRYRGRDVFWWMQASGILSDPIDSQRDVALARAEPSPQLAGRSDGGAIDLPYLLTLDVQVAGRFGGVVGSKLWFADDLPQSMQDADRRMQRMQKRFDSVAGMVDAPEDAFPAPAAPIAGLTELDARMEGIGSIVWATGYPKFSAATAFPGLEPDPSLDEDGVSVRYPGLFALGLPFQRTRLSTFVGGADYEGAITARLISRHLALSSRVTGQGRSDDWKILSPNDADAVRQHFDALPSNDRRLRFGTAVSDTWIARYSGQFFARAGGAVGFVRDGKIVALGEFRPSNSGDPSACELGMSVVPTAQHHGLGRRLLDRLFDLGRRQKYRTAELYIERANTPMKNLCHQCDATWSSHDSLLRVRIPLKTRY